MGRSAGKRGLGSPAQNKHFNVTKEAKLQGFSMENWRRLKEFVGNCSFRKTSKSGRANRKKSARKGKTGCHPNCSCPYGSLFLRCTPDDSQHQACIIHPPNSWHSEGWLFSVIPLPCDPGKANFLKIIQLPATEVGRPLPSTPHGKMKKHFHLFLCRLIPEIQQDPLPYQFLLLGEPAEKQIPRQRKETLIKGRPSAEESLLHLTVIKKN